MEKLKKQPYSVRNDQDSVLEDEMKELKESIIATSEEMVAKHGKDFSSLLSEDSEIELIRINYDYYKKKRMWYY